MASGWICVHRQLLDNPIFKNDKLFRVFMYCLLKASHSDHDQLVGDVIVPVKEGQFVSGRKSISSATNLTEQNVRTALVKLEKLKILTIKATNKFSIISIVNWNKYQQNNQQVTSSQPTSNQQVTTNNNGNNGNNEDNGNKDNSGKQSLPPCPHQEILKAWSEVMPDKTQPRAWDGQRAANLSARWKSGFEIMRSDNKGYLYTDKETGIAFWRAFFQFMRKSDFLMNNCRPFGLDWIVKKENFQKILEHKYHG